MDKKLLRRFWSHSKKIHPWFFLVVTIIFGAISLLSLRANNQQMEQLREAVFAADKEGDTVKLQNSLYNLHKYVVEHMNTSLTSGPNAVHPPIQLRYTYERAQAEQQSQLGQNHAAIYHDAQKFCEQTNPSSDGAATIACIENYTSARGIQLGDIPDAAYKIDYVSAAWSPDLAGWSLLMTLFGALGFILTSLYHSWMKRKL